MRKSAKQWDNFCKAYAANPQRAMKEKGHSRTSSVLKRLHVSKNTDGEQQEQADIGGNVSPSASRKAKIVVKLRIMKGKLPGKDKAETKLESGSLASST